MSDRRCPVIGRQNCTNNNSQGDITYFSCPILPQCPRNVFQLMEIPLNPKKCESSFFSTDPHQATFQPLLNLLGIPLSFNPTPKFLGATVDRTLSFGAHVQSCVPNSIHATKPFAPKPLPPAVPRKNLSAYFTKALCDGCSHMPLLDGSHSSATLQPITWKSYTELHAGLLLGASLPPPPPYSFLRPNSLL